MIMMMMQDSLVQDMRTCRYAAGDMFKRNATFLLPVALPSMLMCVRARACACFLLLSCTRIFFYTRLLISLDSSCNAFWVLV